MLPTFTEAIWCHSFAYLVNSKVEIPDMSVNLPAGTYTYVLTQNPEGRIRAETLVFHGEA